MRSIVAADGDAREHEAEEHAARVPHEDLRRIEVVEKEADGSSRKRRRQHGDERIALLQGDETDGHRRDGGDARRQAVEAVDEVHGIR